eukprot:782013-Amphidinium_carterae.2
MHFTDYIQSAALYYKPSSTTTSTFYIPLLAPLSHSTSTSSPCTSLSTTRMMSCSTFLAEHNQNAELLYKPPSAAFQLLLRHHAGIVANKPRAMLLTAITQVMDRLYHFILSTASFCVLRCSPNCPSPRPRSGGGSLPCAAYT